MSTLEVDYSWLNGAALAVAPRLLNWELVSRTEGVETAGRIVETEAYLGAADPASHAFRGRTARTAPMFERGGTVYVYFSYGVHTCVNLVTGPSGEAGAVLIRALEPTVGQEIMARRRGRDQQLELTNGPGKLAQALGIGLSLSGSSLGQSLSLRPPRLPLEPSKIAAGPRVGVRLAADRPWRFYLKDNPFVSRRRV